MHKKNSTKVQHFHDFTSFAQFPLQINQMITDILSTTFLENIYIASENFISKNSYLLLKMIITLAMLNIIIII